MTSVTAGHPTSLVTRHSAGDDRPTWGDFRGALPSGVNDTRCAQGLTGPQVACAAACQSDAEPELTSATADGMMGCFVGSR